MARQINLDAWQVGQLASLLGRGADAVSKTGRPIVLFRQVLEEEEGAYEEVVCTLAATHVIEQRVASGGVLPPSFYDQTVFAIPDYPAHLLRQSKDRFLDVMDMLEEQLGGVQGRPAAAGHG